MFKRWIPASFIAVAMVLALAGGAVLAFGGSGKSKQSDIFERAASILGIEASAIQDAHDQAKREAHDAKLAAAVERLVTMEVIDQPEADAFTEWMEVRPDSADDALLSELTTSLLSGDLKLGTRSRFETRLFRRTPFDGLTERMAEILGIDSDDLASALDEGETQVEQLSRLDQVHEIVDKMLAADKISQSEADELHAWVDDTPEWLLDLDLPSRMLSGLGIFGERHGGLDFLKPFPFGELDGLEDIEREFRFEFHGPEGSFRFGPDDLEGREFHFPHHEGRLEDLFNRFDELHEFEGLEDIMERLKEHGLFEYDLEEIEPSPETPDETTTSA